MHIFKFIFGFVFLILATTTFAAKPHTWHNITVNSGTWQGSLKMINENGGFVARDGSNLSTFEVDRTHPMEYGFFFAKDADFDVAYTLTLTEKSVGQAMFQSKTCVFVITANGPAKPDVTPLSYHGATCSWKVVPGVGEDYFAA